VTYSIVPWAKKIPKVGVAVSYLRGRHILFDQAVKRPDLFKASFQCYGSNVSPWNPSSGEPEFHCSKMNASDPAFVRKEPGAQTNDSLISKVKIAKKVK